MTLFEERLDHKVCSLQPNSADSSHINSMSLDSCTWLRLITHKPDWTWRTDFKYAAFIAIYPASKTRTVHRGLGWLAFWQGVRPSLKKHWLACRIQLIVWLPTAWSVRFFSSVSPASLSFPPSRYARRAALRNVLHILDNYPYTYS